MGSLTPLNPSYTINDWQPEKVFREMFPHIPEKTLKWQLTNRKHNGLATFVQLIGRTRYIKISGYAQWLETRSARTQPTPTQQ